MGIDGGLKNLRLLLEKFLYMARQKKFNTVDSTVSTIEEKTEVHMTQTVELENLQQEIDKARVELDKQSLILKKKGTS